METNRQEYLQELEGIKGINLLLVGQDPYPKGANGIAFCKESFQELFANNCCGKEVLFSLGITQEVINLFVTPFQLFSFLLGKGVAFVNVSSVLLGQASEESLQQDKAYNESFLSKAKNTVILGKGKTAELFARFYPEYSIQEVLIHPSGLAKKGNSDDWSKTWGTNYLLNTYFSENLIQKSNTMELENHFNLNLSGSALYSNGEVEYGKHGIEVIEGEYYASHFHLKTKIAKGRLKNVLNEMSSKELYNKAWAEADDFNNWPEVKYETDNFTIRKYKFSWLLTLLN